MNIFNKYPYIVIEGPIGSGKSTLAQMLADKFSAQLLSEKAEANPFLSRFYQDAQRYALPTQLFFLFQRSRQISDLNQRDMFKQPTVADFFLEKDPLFARLNLDDEEYTLYHQIYSHLQLKSSKPDLVIYRGMKHVEILPGNGVAGGSAVGELHQAPAARHRHAGQQAQVPGVPPVAQIQVVAQHHWQLAGKLRAGVVDKLEEIARHAPKILDGKRFGFKEDFHGRRAMPAR